MIADQEPKAPAPVDPVPEAPVAQVEQEVEYPSTDASTSVVEPAQTAEAVPESEPASAEPTKDAWSSEATTGQIPAAASAQATSPAAAAAAPAAQTQTYNGPPGLNPAAKTSAAAPIRTSSRAASRFTDGQAVVMPGAASSASSLDMQFGSLSFGNASAGPEPM